MIKILFGALLSISSIINGINGYGYTSPPSNIYRHVGETIEVYCVLDAWALEKGYSSVNLSFSSAKYNISKRQMRIVNETTILLRIENAPAMDATVTCTINNRDGVDQSHVYVGLPPDDVHDFHCISENWQNLTCTFKRNENTIVPLYELYYGVSAAWPHSVKPTQKCELSVDYNQTYGCKIELNSDASGLYRQSWEYYLFKLFALNELGNRTQEFVINNYDSIRPDRVTDLTATSTTSTSIQLTWKIHSDLLNLERQFIFLVGYKSEYDKEWKNETIGPLSVPIRGDGAGRLVEYSLKNLKYAHTWYYIQVAAKVAIKDKLLDTLPDLWSNFSNTAITTGSRIPDNPPATDIGGFSINDYNHVYLYFKALEDWEYNGNNLQYCFVELERDALKYCTPQINTTEPTTTVGAPVYAVKFENVNATDDLTFAIRSNNTEGKSKLASYLRVPPARERCPMPTQIKKIKSDVQTYDFSWQPPANATTLSCPEITSYTVFWCKSKNDSPNSCDGYISFERVSRDVFHFERKSMVSLNFAVSANSHNSSSGMIWTKCTALAGNDLSKLTSIHVLEVAATSIEFRWELQCIEQSIIKGYTLHYCPVKDENSSECIEPIRTIDIHREKKGYKLTGLLPYTVYKTQIQMISGNSSGPPSDAIVKRTLEAAPSPPQNLRYSEVTNTSVILSWDRPTQVNGELTRYKIYYNERERTVDAHFTNDTVEFCLDGLKSFHEYDVLVKAWTVAESNESNKIKFKTAVGTPSSIWQPNKIDLNGRNIVRWHEPEIRAGRVQFYELRVQIKMMHDPEWQERIIRINGTQCSLAIAVCQTEELHFSVRAVNVINSAHADQEVIKHYIRRRDVRKRHSNPEISTGSRQSNFNNQEPHPPPMQNYDSHKNPEFNHICIEQHDERLERYLNADKHATRLSGSWSPTFQFACNHEASGGFYFMLVFLAIITAALVYAALIARRKLQKMKDIGVELPAGLEDIKEENKGKNLEGGINPRENINHDVDLIYSSEQEQSLLRSRMESASSISTENNSQCGYNEVADNSEYDQPTEDDSAQSLSETVEIDKLSPTPLLPVSIPNRSLPPIPRTDKHNDNLPESMIFSSELMKPLSGHLVSSSNYTQASSLTRPNNTSAVTSNGYVTHDAIIGKQTGGYTPWSALDSKSQTDSPAQTPNGDDHKLKTPVVASTDIQGISGYVTHKQLSDFGQLMH